MNTKNVSIQIMIISLPCHTGQCRFRKSHGATVRQNLCFNPIIIIDLHGTYPGIHALARVWFCSFSLQEASADPLFDAVFGSGQDSPVGRSSIARIIHECPTEYVTVELFCSLEIIGMDLEMDDTIAHTIEIKK